MLVDQPAQHIIDHTTHAYDYQWVGVTHHFFPEFAIKRKADLSELFPENKKYQQTAAKITDQVIANTYILVVKSADESIRMICRILWNDTEKQNDDQYIHDHTGNTGK